MARGITEKYIALDEPTMEFLTSLKDMREGLGMRYQDVARQVGIDITAIHKYEIGNRKPNLGTLMKLAEFFEQDLSASINYKFYHGQICATEIKHSLNKYGLTYPELSRLTGYDTERIAEAVNLRPNGSILCLWSVIEVIESEAQMWHFRRNLLRKGSCRKAVLR